MIQNRFIAVLLLAGSLFFGCTDTRDEHYKRSDALPDQNLRELIAGYADLSVFSKLVEIAGYNDLLSSSQTFTVWAPENSAFTDINPDAITTDEARLIVENHIARYNCSTSKDPQQAIRMKNNKVYYFSDGGSLFGGISIQKHDILAKNGILHTLQSRIPYLPNIYEYILTSPNTSKMAEFVSQFDEYIIDPQSIDADGTIRDTVYIRYNPLFDLVTPWVWFGTTIHTGLGQINSEDSIYTALIPDNAAWDAAYARISPYFKVVRGNDSIQQLQTSLAIIEDLFYRGAIDDPAGKDTLVSTSPSVIRQPATLFGGARKIPVSNGLVFLTENNVNYDPQETFQKPIYVEADAQDGRKVAANTTIVPRILDGDLADMATDSRFLEVYQTSLDDNLNNQPKVTFDIPQVLSGKYNVYAEFLPGELAQQGDQRATKLTCTLNYRNANGNTVTSVVSNMETSITDKVKLLLFSGFTFPVANYYDRLWATDFLKGLHTVDDRVVATKLDIAVRVTAAEYNTKQYGRSFCLDRIILEPVN